jgi:CheY-like chemotaxis protein
MAHMNRDAARDLQARVDELEKADRAKEQFLALLSHELRNHIHAIRTNAWLIKARAKDPDLARPTEAIDRQVDKLSRLVEDLLDVIRVAQKSAMSFQDSSLQQIVGAAIAATRAAVNIDRRELNVRVPGETLCVHVDPARLQQAIGNLLQNAVKFSPQQGTIYVHVYEDGGKAVISIRDHGIGIAAADLPEIFKLAIEKNGKTAGNGLGIGLHIAHELVEAHGGTIEARSAGVGQGSEFIMRLPLVPRTPKEAAEQEFATSTDQPLSVLVVDDNHDAADSLAAVLETFGHKVHSVYGGEAAVQRAARGDIEVALVDIGMPTVDGFQVAERISSTPSAHNTLHVALTGWGEKGDRDRSKAAGFAYHLTKPVDIDALASLLATAARRKQH